jgi:hypothetical protein
MMSEVKTKSIRNIEERMGDTDISSLRYRVLESAKQFKTSWIELGQALYTVWKDRLYRDWGYSTFDVYAAKEIGIRKQTAVKLLKSYYFLEQEEPVYLKQDYKEQAGCASVPTFECVDALRQAKNKKGIDKEDYERIRKNVFEQGKDAVSVKKDLTALIKQRQELLPQEARQKKKQALLRRLLGLLKSVRAEIKIAKVLPMQILKEADKLISRIESEML